MSRIVFAEALMLIMIRIGVDALIIQDGNYGDFAVGQEAKFALEFYPPHGLRPAGEGPRTAEHLAASRYRIHGQVVFADPHVWVIDAGRFVAYRVRQPTDDAGASRWVEG